MYDQLVKKVNAIDTSRLVNKIDYNARMKYIENKIPSVTSLGATPAIDAVEKKIRNLNDLVKKKL